MRRSGTCVQSGLAPVPCLRRRVAPCLCCMLYVLLWYCPYFWLCLFVSMECVPKSTSTSTDYLCNCIRALHLFRMPLASRSLHLAGVLAKMLWFVTHHCLNLLNQKRFIIRHQFTLRLVQPWYGLCQREQEVLYQQLVLGHQ